MPRRLLASLVGPEESHPYALLSIANTITISGSKAIWSIPERLDNCRLERQRSLIAVVHNLLCRANKP